MIVMKKLLIQTRNFFVIEAEWIQKLLEKVNLKLFDSKIYIFFTTYIWGYPNYEFHSGNHCDHQWQMPGICYKKKKKKGFISIN